MIVDVKKYKEFCVKALVKCGVKAEAAEAVADCCVMTDMMGITTHGTVNLPKYLNKMRALYQYTPTQEKARKCSEKSTSL